MANKRKKFIPDNWIELMFGVGASIVIIGALLKITHSDFILMVSFLKKIKNKINTTKEKIAG